MIVDDYQLNPGEYALLPGHGPKIHLFVFSLSPVNAFIVDSANLERYRHRQQFKHHGPGTVTSFSAFLEVPGSGECFAIIENPAPESVQVSVKVWN